MTSMRVKTLSLVSLCVVAACLVIALSTCGLSEPPKDPRLDQKVTVKSAGMTLGQLTAMLSSQTGVKLSARPDNADFRVVAMAKDLPLGELLDAVGEALHLQLYRQGKEGEWDYYFEEDAKTREEAPRLKKKAADLLPGQMMRATEVLKLPEDRIEKAIKEDKIIQPFLDQKQFRMGVAIYGQLSDAQRSRLLTHHFLTVQMSKLPDDLRGQVVDLFNENQRQRAKAENVKLNDKLIAIYWETLDDPLSGKSLWLNFIGSENNNLTLVYNPSSEAGPNLVGNEDLFTTKIEEDEVLGGIYVVVPKKPLEGRLAEPIKVKFDKEIDFAQALDRIHGAEGVNFVADFFLPRYAMSAKVNDWTFVQGETFGQLIEKVTGLFQCRWRMRGNVCLISSKEWFDDRDTVVPQSKILQWQEAVRTSGRFELSEILEIASLNDKAIKSLQYLGVSCPGTFHQNLRALRFAGSLTPEQRKAAESKDGLPAAKLTGRQLDTFLTWMESPVGQDQRPSKLSEDDAEKAVIRIIHQDEGTYAFEIKTPAGRTRMDVVKLM